MLLPGAGRGRGVHSPVDGTETVVDRAGGQSRENRGWNAQFGELVGLVSRNHQIACDRIAREREGSLESER